MERFMNRAVVVAAAIGLLAAPGAGGAQQRWSVELRVGAAVPTQTLGGTDLELGLGGEGTVAFRFMPHVSMYVGWDWVHFPTEQSFAGPDMDFEETGYAFGLRFDHPFRGESTGLAYQIRVGATYNHIEIEDSGGELAADSGHGLGWEIGTGVVLPLGGAWRLTPGIRYRSLGRELVVGSLSQEVDLTYAALELGFARHF
jgi:hypothetical protein